MTAATAAGPVVHTIRLRSVWALLAAVVIAHALGVPLATESVALSGTIVIPLVSVLAWQWDTTTGADVAERDRRVAHWRAVTGRRPGLAGAVGHAASVLERWARAELAGLRAAGGAR